MRLGKGQTVLENYGPFTVIVTTNPENMVYEIREGTYLLWERIVRFGSSKQFKAGGTAFQEAEAACEAKLKELLNGI